MSAVVSIHCACVCPQEVLFDEDSDEPPPTAVVSSKLEELLTRVRQKSHKKRAVGKIPFILGEGVKLSVGVYNLVRYDLVCCGNKRVSCPRSGCGGHNLAC